MAEDRIKIGELSPGDVALLKDIAEASSEKAVSKCLLIMGLNMSDPIQAQEDFSILRQVGKILHDPEIREDLAWLRRARTRSDGIIGKILLTAIGISVAGAMHIVWDGLKSLLTQAPPH